MDRVAEVPSTSRMKERYKGKCHVSERAGLLSCADLRVKQKQLRRRSAGNSADVTDRKR